jgi:hypothetical protein
MTEFGDIDLCGWRVASAIALPDLPRWIGDPRAPDVRIEIGTVPTFEHSVMTTPMLQIDGEGRARFGINGVADYLVENGRRITIAPQAPIDSPDIRLFLLGSGFGLLCHQRGVLPIHASTVDIDGEAVLLAGASGAGKSTLAAAFLRRGLVLSDDVSPLDLSGVEPVILPGLRRIRLWSDSIVDAGWNKQDMERCRAGLEKFSRSIGGETSVKPLTPRAIFHLRRQSDKSDGSRFRRLRGRPAAEEFRRQIYRWRSLVGFAGKAAAMARAAIAASRIPQHFIVERALNYAQLDAVVDDIIATVRAAR